MRKYKRKKKKRNRKRKRRRRNDNNEDFSMKLTPPNSAFRIDREALTRAR